jgi:hypothetical protein
MGTGQGLLWGLLKLSDFIRLEKVGSDMAALSITAANVKWIGGTRPRIVKGGATGTRGQVVYKDSADNEHKLADADALATAAAAGILVTDMNDGGDCLIAVPGSRINIGATATAGVAYVADEETPGAIVPLADITTGDFSNLLFWGEGSANVTLVLAAAPVANA